MINFRVKKLGKEKSFRISEVLTVTVVDTWRNPRPREVVFDRYAWDEVKRVVLEEEGYREPRPAQKPWNNAKPGEVWVLTLDGDEQVALYLGGGCWKCGLGGLTVYNPGKRITEARRIWPESKET